jgi:hypothetical protein
VASFGKEVEKLGKEFTQIIDLNVSHWGLAALSSIGDMYYYAFTTLENTPPPSFFDEETKEFFRNTLIENAVGLKNQAIASYNLCLNKSLQVQWFNQWTDQAEKKLAEIQPENFTYSYEEKGTPVFFGSTEIKQPLVLKIEEEREE